MDLNQVTLPALDVAASVEFYRGMGFELIVHSPHYARFKATVGETSFSVHETDELSASSQAVVYFECADVDAQVAELQSRGYVFEHEAQDERWQWREARLLDPSGNVLCLYNAGENRLDPPWRVRS